jgi:hypothetical protein
MKIGNIGYLATKETEQRSTENPNWKVSTMGVFTSLDIGRNVMTTSVIADPTPLKALDHLLEMQFSAMEELVDLLPGADNPIPILRLLAEKWATYQLEGPVVRTIPVKKVQVLHADKGAIPADGDLEAGWMMYMDRAHMEPRRIRNQKLKVIQILLSRINGESKNDFGISRVMAQFARKVRGRITGTDVASRLNSPIYKAYFAMSMAEEYGRIAAAAYKGDDITQATLFSYMELELLQEMEAIITDPTVSTFTKTEIPDARHLDHLKWWFESIKLMAPIISVNFRRLPVGHRIICESANRGRWTLIMTPEWGRIYYGKLINQLDIAGYSSSILMPTGIIPDTSEPGPYRTTRDPSELGLELTVQDYDNEQYEAMVGDIQLAIGERDFLKHYPSYLGRPTVPLRSSVLRQMPQLQVLQTGVCIEIMASDVLAVNTPAVLAEQLQNTIYKYKPTVFETISPWIPS